MKYYKTESLKMADCPICCLEYNKSVRKEISCESSSCNFSACKTCIRSYLTTSLDDPGCMQCRRAWSQRFLSDSLNKSFVTGELKKYRHTILADREMSRLQESVEDAQREVERERLEKEKKELTEQAAVLKRELLAINTKIGNISNRQFHLRFGGDGDSGGGAERKQFIMPCPADGCRGFLSKAWKCELCGLYTCKECFEILGDRKTDEHTCSPDNVASAELIRKETKPCPTCGTRIFKIDGCDQMWCTQCKVAFSWRTGKICTSQSIHNPHYLEWQRNAEGNDIMRAVGDVPCGGLITHYQCDRIVRKASELRLYRSEQCIRLRTPLRGGQHFLERVIDDLGYDPLYMNHAFYDTYRVATDIVNHTVPEYRRAVTELQNYSPLRVQYMLNRIDKAEFGRKVFLQDSKRQKMQQILHILELLSAVLCETFNEVSRFTNDSIQYGKSKTEQRFPFNPTTCTHPDVAIDILEKQYTLNMSSPSTPKSPFKREKVHSELEIGYVMVGALERLSSLFHYANGELAIISSSFSSHTPFIRIYPNYWTGLTEINTQSRGSRRVSFERSHKFSAEERRKYQTQSTPEENVKIKNS